MKGGTADENDEARLPQVHIEEARRRYLPVRHLAVFADVLSFWKTATVVVMVATHALGTKVTNLPGLHGVHD